MNTKFFDLPINKSPANIMHIDVNSCFATVEQQANPFLRGKPIAVMANVNKPYGVVLAASIEAKKTGVKTAMRYRDAKKLCPQLIQVKPDADKYRAVHLGMRKIFSDYTDNFQPKSIDEFVLDLSEKHRVKTRCHPERVKRAEGSVTNVTRIRERFLDYARNDTLLMTDIAQEMKQRIRNEIGEWISVSVGIGTNRFFAKTAAGIIKPNGLVVMDHKSAEDIYKKMDLLDIHGINIANKSRLNSVGIYTPLQFFEADVVKLKQAFKSVGANYWYTRLRGCEIDSVEFSRRSFGNTRTLSKSLTKIKDLTPLLMKLTTKAAARLRKKGYKARGVHLGLRYDNFPYWHKGVTHSTYFFNTLDIYKIAFKLLKQSPRKPVRNIAVTVFDIKKDDSDQLNLFDDVAKAKKLVGAIDEINNKWGDYSVVSARMIQSKSSAPDVIGFGNVKEL